MNGHNTQWIAELNQLTQEFAQENDRAEAFEQLLEEEWENNLDWSRMLVMDKAKLAEKRLTQLIALVEGEVSQHLKTEREYHNGKLGVMGQCFEHLEQAMGLIHDAIMESDAYSKGEQ